MARHIIFLFVVGSVLLAACRPAADEPQTLTVFAAASLTDAFTALGEEFETLNPGVMVTFNFAGSQQLAQQLSQGAPGDVFASANARQMEEVVANGRIDPAAPRPFVQNRLVIIVPATNPANVQGLADLARPGTAVLLADASVPAGQYSLDFLQMAAADSQLGGNYRDGVLANVVSYEQNVRTVFTKVALGEADAGIVYSSNVVGVSSESVIQFDIPDDLNVIAVYPIAPLADSLSPTLAQHFVDFVLSGRGQAILESYGFVSVSAE